MSIKNIKEKELLINLSKTFGQEIDPSIVEEVNRQKEFENGLKQAARNNWLNDLQEALKSIKQDVEEIKEQTNYPVPPSLDELEAFLSDTTEEVNDLVSQPQSGQIATQSVESEQAPETIVERTARAIKVNENSFQQPNPPAPDAQLKALVQKVKFLEQWLGKVSVHGPGGGAGSEARLDRETKLVDTPTYNITTKDFYVGVNYTGPVTISLPTIVKNGTMYIVKDESGNCANNPITVTGNVDNDPGGFILMQNNGGIQMIYRNGWRIV